MSLNNHRSIVYLSVGRKNVCEEILHSLRNPRNSDYASFSFNISTLAIGWNRKNINGVRIGSNLDYVNLSNNSFENSFTYKSLIPINVYY